MITDKIEHYMATWRNKIPLLNGLVKNRVISLAGCTHLWKTFQHTKKDFVISSQPCISLYMYLPASEQEKSEFETVNMNKYLPVLEERQDTEADESLQELKAVIQKGWPEHKSNLPSNML